MEKFVTVLNTQWGYMKATWTDLGLWELEFPEKDKPEIGEASVDSRIAAWSEELCKELNQYWKGFFVEFGVPVDWRGYTPFQASVLQYTAGIAYGEKTTYGAIAQALGRPKAARAVGGSLHINRTPIVVPCHRVVGASGSLTGFAGGLDMKKALLLLESNPE